MRKANFGEEVKWNHELRPDDAKYGVYYYGYVRYYPDKDAAEKGARALDWYSQQDAAVVELSC